MRVKYKRDVRASNVRSPACISGFARPGTRAIASPESATLKIGALPTSSKTPDISFESADQAKLPTEYSQCTDSIGCINVGSQIFPDCRSCTRSRHLSASKPARACERQARYFPSGE